MPRSPRPGPRPGQASRLHSHGHATWRAAPCAPLLLLLAGAALAGAALPEATLLGATSPEGQQRPHVFSLNRDWTLANATRGVQVAGSVPGGVYTDLRRSGHLPQDIFYRFNDREYRWVSQEDWTYSRTFHVPQGARGKANQVLVLHGVDTVADIYLNGQLVGKTDNMFVRYRFDVKSVLKEEAVNTLEVRFSSPLRVAKERAAEQAKTYVVPPKCTDPSYHGECWANHLRKMQASFAWDWGPAFPSMGLWKGVELEAYDLAVLREVGFTSTPSTDSWSAAVRVHWEVGAGPVSGLPAAIKVIISSPGGTVVARQTMTVSLTGDARGLGHTDITISVPKASVQQWWPNGMGDPVLYDLTVLLLDSPDAPLVRDQLIVKVGFRTVELVQEAVVEGDASKGLTYYFRVNGKEVFAKGSNWIPAHILPERGADPDVVKHLLFSAKEANMNMLRVWGGGVYESDLFYQLADELGIMVWQDMMFACSMYPVGTSFLASVDEEVRQQYRRLNHHPSIVVWAANNENEAALRGNWYGTAGDLFNQYHADYKKLYVDTVRAAVQDEGSSTPFAVSSPSNGVESENSEDFLAKNPYSSLYGDDHHYDYLSDAWNPAVFHHTRFGSEYGFMSWPSRSTLEEATDQPDDLAMGSPFAAWRQHHPAGNLEMALQIVLHFVLPSNHNDTEHFDDFIYFTQIYQAVATKTETEFLRRSRNLLTDAGEGRTMGALYWQLNDVWQAPSWSGIDFSGRWKLLHHMAVDFMAPVLVSPHLTEDELAVDVVSDEDRDDVLQVHTEVLDWRSFGTQQSRMDNVRLQGPGVVRAWQGSLKALLAGASCADSCLLRFSISDSTGKDIGPENYLLPRSPKETTMANATFQVTGVSGPLAGTQHQQWDYTLSLSSSAPAAFVWLQAGRLPGRFSRNGFHLTSPSALVLRFHTDQRMTAAELEQAITVTALNGRYSYSPAPAPSSTSTSTSTPEPTGAPGGAPHQHVALSLSMVLLSLGPLAVLL